MSSRSLRKQGAYDTRCNVYAETRRKQQHPPLSSAHQVPAVKAQGTAGESERTTASSQYRYILCALHNFPSLRTFKIANVDNLLSTILYSAGFQSRDTLPLNRI